LSTFVEGLRVALNGRAADGTDSGMTDPLSSTGALRRLAATVGTPFYLYDAAVVKKRIALAAELTAGEDLQARYAMKAC
jgi:diaminopimelate decarboxylase